jgi:tetraacyldisaccharide 4'-kinase
MDERSRAEWLWWSDSAGARIARAAGSPFSLAYSLITRARNALYDSHTLRTHTPRLPALSVGNLTVGGTGKTPVSSWLARQLEARGAHPAIVMRGYGDDESLVHARLAPSIPVIADPNRVQGISHAAKKGADVTVLDDAFQHRRVARAADVVLISADAPDVPARVLPTGPYREREEGLRRASLIIVTRKAAPIERARAVVAHANAIAPGIPAAIVHLALDTITVDGQPAAPLASAAGQRVLAIAGVGNADAFAEQLRQAGAVVRLRAFADHHAFSPADAQALARDLESGEIAICTLKDAVKLAPLWPREAAAIGYVSQAVIVEERGDAIDAVLDLVLHSRLRQL